ncbi:MAG TPA: ABC transporter permease [Xanthobacteraceae bacterium]|nr:ABC transporter permease [Xanthobacteraceae bacterium]
MSGYAIDNRWTSSPVAEILDGLRLVQTWSLLAWYDIVIRYRRTFLGPFWLTLTLAIFVAALGLVYSTIFQAKLSEYLPYIAAGIVAWIFIATVLSESCVVFIEAEPIIKNTRIPLTVFPCRVALRNLIILLHNMPVVIVLIIAFGVPLRWSTSLVVLGIAFLYLNALWSCLLVGVLATRYRDVQPLLTNLLQIAFLVTPIFWSPNLLGRGRYLLADPNPLYHFVEIFRAPLLGQVPSALNYGVVVATTIIGWGTALALFYRVRGRIAFWL